MMANKKTDNKREAPGGADVKISDATTESLGAGEVQAKMDEETEQGFRGLKTDKTPNENYTVAGVTSGAPTPETDPELARKAGSNRFAHVEEGGEK